MESVRSAPDFGREVQLTLLRHLINGAEGLERSLGSKYPGTKRFGLEGGESLIPMLSEAMIQRCGRPRRAGEIVYWHGTPGPT